MTYRPTFLITMKSGRELTLEPTSAGIRTLSDLMIRIGSGGFLPSMRDPADTDHRRRRTFAIRADAVETIELADWSTRESMPPPGAPGEDPFGLSEIRYREHWSG